MHQAGFPEVWHEESQRRMGGDPGPGESRYRDPEAAEHIWLPQFKAFCAPHHLVGEPKDGAELAGPGRPTILLTPESSI